MLLTGGYWTRTKVPQYTVHYITVSTVQYSTVQTTTLGVPVHLVGQLVGAAGVGGGPGRAGRGAAPARLRGIHRDPGTGEQLLCYEGAVEHTVPAGGAGGGRGGGRGPPRHHRDPRRRQLEAGGRAAGSCAGAAGRGAARRGVHVRCSSQ